MQIPSPHTQRQRHRQTGDGESSGKRDAETEAAEGLEEGMGKHGVREAEVEIGSCVPREKAR